MKIKLAILEKDQNYLMRLVSAFSTRYADKFQIYSFTDLQIAYQALETSRVDVFIASDAFDIDLDAVPKRCGFAYLVDSPGIDSIKDQRAICKFQKADLIYKQILSIYSENAGSVSGLKLGDDSTQIIMFSSPNGGVGTSSMAAACAQHFASAGKNTLYLNFEKFGVPDLFFDAEGYFDISDVIYALKSRKSNLSMKLESCVKQDQKGVFFFSKAKVALDMFELTTDEIIRMISELKLTGAYEYIIIDMDFSVSKDILKVYKQAHSVVWVGDGSEISNTKIQRAFNAFSIMEQNEESPLVNRLCLVYNKFSNKSGKTVGDIELRNVGGAPVYMHASTKQVIDQLATMTLFDNLL